MRFYIIVNYSSLCQQKAANPIIKKQAAEKALQFVQEGQIIGLGDGSTMLHLADFIVADKSLAASLTFTSSSAKTSNRLSDLGVTVLPPSKLSKIDRYFDGCDQFDRDLNALKSGGGIHTIEKIVANMAGEFILVGDAEKYSEQLSTRFPVVIEIIPAALSSVIAQLQRAFPASIYHLRQSPAKAETATNERGNYLLNVTFDVLPDLEYINTYIKLLPGVVDHSLFYRLATKAVVAGPDGVRLIYPAAIA